MRMEFEDFRDPEIREKVIRICGHLARGDVNRTDVDEWGCAGPELAKRLSKCLLCEYYGMHVGDGVGPQCTYVERQLWNSFLINAWERCPLNKWGEDYETINRFFYDEALSVIENGYPDIEYMNEEPSELDEEEGMDDINMDLYTIDHEVMVENVDDLKEDTTE